jgi:hypothetical protein
MITTIYKCDCCGKEQDTQEQMWVLAVTVSESRTDYRGNHYTPVRKEQLWCRACIEKVKLLPTVKVQPEEVKELTIKELVRQIVQEEIAP